MRHADDEDRIGANRLRKLRNEHEQARDGKQDARDDRDAMVRRACFE